jgi:CysZ protein
MIKATFRALGDLLSPDFRSVLMTSIALAIALFAGILLTTEALIAALTRLPWPWAEALLAIGTGLALFVAFFFLMAPVMALFAGLFLDRIAARVEAVHYPLDPPGEPQAAGRAIITGIQFAVLVLLVNLAVLPLVFTGIGALALVAVNAYLLGREYFEMAAVRHMPPEEAKGLRQANSPQIFVAGLVPALMSMVPVVNLVVPLFATAYFVHIFKWLASTSR